MISKALIVKKINDYKFIIRIPTINKTKGAYGATPDENLYQAYTITLPGILPNYNVNDIVCVSYEEGIVSQPVILGLLYREAVNNSQSTIKADSLIVDTSVSLPTDTSIGDIDSTIFNTLQGGDGSIDERISANNANIYSVQKTIKDDILPTLPKLYKWDKYDISYVRKVFSSGELLYDQSAPQYWDGESLKSAPFNHKRVYKNLITNSDTKELTCQNEILPEEYDRYSEEDRNNFFDWHSIDELIPGETYYVQSLNQPIYICSFMKEQDTECYIKNYELIAPNLVPGKGDTFIEVISSVDPQAYPSNGEQDGYWYIRQSEV